MDLEVSDPPEMPESGSKTLPARETKFEFSDTDLNRFWAEKWKIRACEICEVADWNVHPRNFDVTSVSDGRQFGTISKYVRVYLSVSCRNCGNTKFLYAGVVDAWIKAHP